MLFEELLLPKNLPCGNCDYLHAFSLVKIRGQMSTDQNRCAVVESDKVAGCESGTEMLEGLLTLSGYQFRLVGFTAEHMRIKRL